MQDVPPKSNISKSISSCSPETPKTVGQLKTDFGGAQREMWNKAPSFLCSGMASTCGYGSSRFLVGRNGKLSRTKKSCRQRREVIVLEIALILFLADLDERICMTLSKQDEQVAWLCSEIYIC